MTQPGTNPQHDSSGLPDMSFDTTGVYGGADGDHVQLGVQQTSFRGKGVYNRSVTDIRMSPVVIMAILVAVGALVALVWFLVTR